MTTKKTPPRKLKAGRRTARTQGMSQSAFAGYGTQQQAPVPAKEPASQTEKKRTKKDADALDSNEKGSDED